MTIKEVQDKMKGYFDLTKMKVSTEYIFRFGSKGTVKLHYINNDLVQLSVDGNKKEEIKKILGIEWEICGLSFFVHKKRVA